MDIEILDIGLVEYEKGIEFMKEKHKEATEKNKNFLILCEHYDIFTVGANEDIEKFKNLNPVKTDRGGSITFHGIGQPIFYFVFEAKNPPFFYRRVIKAFDNFFKDLDKRIFYDNKNPGFYIQNRKLASLGFRYSRGYSLHGIAVNHSVNLEKFNLINPCNLQGIKATSLINEGINIEKDILKNKVVEEILRSWKKF
ncbi:lipoyl(octanoyl) transferase LipB [Venenivibrio stagnispumantis]|uniref:Octanoyltransferase n=1 Tax=Venenivibrio stagnispumantis TaxID=407998 RepID=A0AA46ADB5_9AQUI|nr:lipoyl(octanoyl) transferase LipB [Venenivibrio stagnispumantis]MCW4572401.1 lipoyl(octanoyl) transferase LipB [Venenivibrio stagnispumantis]SMP03779.1 lipoyl(octanoyl) transferase [Venenivibrio stagnispumantis]